MSFTSMAESTRKASLQWRIPPPIIALLLLLPIVSGSFFKPFNVSYDHRALIVAGKRRMLVSAGVHYPRATPQMWPDLIAKSKEGGADVVQTYVFWSGHEPVKGQYNFEGRYDLVKFVKLVGSSGLYLHLRIGPYVCAEWNFGGFPVWLRDVPGIEFRTDNEPFKKEMQKFVTKIVDLMREAELFCWQGGPVIMLQIENEYGDVEKSYGQKGKDYVKWAASMALGLGAGVPWVMCKQTDAPENILDACNGYYCDGFKPNSKTKPVLWTEDWDGWYTKWGGSLPHRPAEDLAFAVARFYQRGGSFQNYYMYFGGTNFGRTSGGPFYITSYDYDAPLDEYGLRSEPKWGHLKDLHAAIKLSEPALVAADAPQYKKLGSNQEAHVYHGDGETGGKVCAAFLANIDEHKTAYVKFNGQSYTLPPWSVSILPDCRHVAYNTAKVGAQTSVKTVESAGPPLGSLSILQKVARQNNASYISKSWMALKEPIGIWGENNFTTQGLLEHLNVTKDQSDYLWHKTRISVTEDDISFWKKNGANPTLSVDSMRDVLRVFVNKQLSGSIVGHWVKAEQPVLFVQGNNDLLLLTQTVGLQNYGAFLEKDGAWGGYDEVLEMARKVGLKVQAVMSFHQCGGNVGDSVTIPLPQWVVEEVDNDPDLGYTDQWGRRNHEYISLGADTLPLLKGRTPVQCYSDFMRAFRDNFRHLLGDTIVEIQVGMGPAGELRYPSYPEQDGTWKFPGIGAFQCYDKYSLSSLKAAAEAYGKPEWGSTGPTDAGHYNNWPEDTHFFKKEDGGWNTEYGEFFLTWYSQMLLDHGERILSSAKSIFESTSVKISAKVAGIHWHYGTRSHAPELTAGYYNTRFRDGYLPIAQMLARHKAVFNFTCIEMRDHEQPQDALCAPEQLVNQVALATLASEVPLAGENALPRYDDYAHEQILKASALIFDRNNEGESREMCAFTYLRMNPELFRAENWGRFVGFVKRMGEGRDSHRCWEEVEREAEHFVHVTQPLVQEAAVALTH